jgi:glycolate oxidase FAD binding subunit
MNEGTEKTARLLGSIVGEENLQEEPALRIDNHEPSMLALPGSAGEVADCLRVCSEAKLSVIPAGFMTWLDGGNPLRRADLVLSLRRMSRVVDYSPPDLTITVEAGASLCDLNSLALKEGQWLPLDPPGYSNASVGAVVSCASSGPLRFGFGTPRDYVIGLRLAHVDGALSKSGGRVVKNVAGYDMNKLYVGSFGTLGVITETTFKLRPKPETVMTLSIEEENPARLALIAESVLIEGLQPASIVLKSERGCGHALIVRFIDSEAAVRHQVDRVLGLAGRSASILEASEQERAWSQVVDLERFGKAIVRISAPISEMRGLVDEVVAHGSARFAEADMATGIIRLALHEEGDEAVARITKLRSRVRTLGGTLFIERADPLVRERASAWNEVGPTAGLMTAIKAKFDPQGLLNPGRFVEGI